MVDMIMIGSGAGQLVNSRSMDRAMSRLPRQWVVAAGFMRPLGGSDCNDGAGWGGHGFAESPVWQLGVKKPGLRADLPGDELMFVAGVAVAGAERRIEDAAMNAQRTGGMIAIGIINIVFGSLWCIGALLTVLGGGLLAAVGSAAEQDMAGQSGQAAAFGGAIVLLGLFALIIGATLLISGIGVISVKPWSRSLSLAAAALWIVITVGQAVLLSAFGLGTIVSLVYPLVLLGLFLGPKWTAAFSGHPVGIGDDGIQPTPAISDDSDQFRHAA